MIEYQTISMLFILCFICKIILYSPDIYHLNLKNFPLVELPEVSLKIWIIYCWMDWNLNHFLCLILFIPTYVLLASKICHMNFVLHKSSHTYSFMVSKNSKFTSSTPHSPKWYTKVLLNWYGYNAFKYFGWYRCILLLIFCKNWSFLTRPVNFQKFTWS